MDQQALVAAEPVLHQRIQQLGYTLAAGNRYTRETPDGRLDIDLVTLFHIVHRHHDHLAGWRLNGQTLAGTRRDAATALKALAEGVDRGRWAAAVPSATSPARFSALVRRYAQPNFSRTSP
jgi:hypothetical protein